MFGLRSDKQCELDIVIQLGMRRSFFDDRTLERKLHQMLGADMLQCGDKCCVI